MTPDHSAIHRGRRIAPRTGVCRPCLVWEPQSPDHKQQAVILDLNPHGMKMRMLKMLPQDTKVFIQLMRDEDFQIPLSQPLQGQLVRVNTADDGFIDYGVRLIMENIKTPAGIAQNPEPTSSPLDKLSSRMHTRDITYQQKNSNQPGRRRG